jgi:hypothetical protein
MMCIKFIKIFLQEFFMKNLRTLLLMVLLAVCFTVIAQTPQPVVKVGFDNLTAEVYTGTQTVYQQGEIYSYDDAGTLIEPVLSYDDLFSYTYQLNGAVGVFGGGITYQGPELASALSGIEKMTVVCVFSPQSYAHEGNSILFSAENTSGGHSIAVMVDRWNRVALCVNDHWEETSAYALDPVEDQLERHPACWDANVNTWSFVAVTYDGSVDIETADPYLEEYQNVRHYIAQNATTGNLAVANKGAIDPLNYPCLYAGSVADTLKLWVANCPDTSARLDDEGGLVIDPSFSAAFPARIKDILIFNSVLPQEQIAELKASLTSASCGGDGSPYQKGDINFDCSVDVLDIQLMASNWLSSIDVVSW